MPRRSRATEPDDDNPDAGGTRDDNDLTAHVRKLYSQIYAVIRKVPRSHVATYGQVAELAGIPGGGRIAGASLKVSKPTDQLPWQRIVGKASKTRGKIAIHDPVGAAIQRQLLEDEGVAISEVGLIDLNVHGWLPGDAPSKPARAGSGRGASPRRQPRSGSKRRASSSRR